MHKKISIGISLTGMILAALIAVGATVPITLMIVNNKVGNLSRRQAIYNKIGEIDAKVRSNFLYPINEADLIEAVANGYVNGLDDDYAAYLNENTLMQKTDENEGKTAGMGISVSNHPDDGKIYIIYVSRNSPAATAGLKKGDCILKIGDIDATEKRISEFTELAKGKVGEKRDLVIQRDDKQLNITVTLAQFEDDSVRFNIVNNIGYIKVTEFNDATVKQFDTAIKELMDAKITGIVFDLRNNPGGLVEPLVKILDKLLPSGNLITVKYKDGTTKVTDKSDDNEISLPMAVLVDGDTASCAEIFAMNIRDFDKGKIIGTKTYGKGIIQTTYELSDKTAIKFTVGEIVDKKGESYHKKGLVPDIEIELSAEQQKYVNFLSEKEDAQVQAAIASITK